MKRGSETRRWLEPLVALAVIVCGALSLGPASRHLRAAALLARFDGTPSALAEVGRQLVDESLIALDVGSDRARARLYVPRDSESDPTMVLVHGVHRLGIDEPRLQRFARATAATGLVVMTPEIAALADYRVEPRSLEVIGAAVRRMRAATAPPRGRVGLVGFSFAGGLALVAAADPRFAPDIDYVVTVGGHHDLARVSRFLVTGEIARPDGTMMRMSPHSYGVLVLVYTHLERFFSVSDVAAAREALRLWLGEAFDAARARARDLCPASRATMDALFEGHFETISAELLRAIDDEAPQMRAVSPSDALHQVRVPVFVLHGTDDPVIPSSESLWIARRAPRLGGVLITSAMVHVEVDGRTHALQRGALVHFVAGLLEAAGP